jgi:hypothetical protein
MNTKSTQDSKTILFPVFEGIEGKNLLRTPVMLHLLSHADVRVVIVVKNEDRRAYYTREIQHDRIQFVVHTGRSSRNRWREHIFETLRYYLLRSRTTTLRAKLISKAQRGKLFYYYKLTLHAVCARPPVRRVVRWLDYSFNVGGYYTALLREQRPRLVVIANQMDPDEVALAKEARHMSIRTVGYMNSWDKITARSAMRVLTDDYTVYNDVLREQMQQFQDVPPTRVVTVGLPQYDNYFQKNTLHTIAQFYSQPLRPYLTRAEYTERIGISEQDRILLYSPIGSAFSHSDWDMIDLLHSFEKNHWQAQRIRLFVRFPPNDAVQEQEIAQRPWLRYEIPSKRFSKHRGGDWDMSFEQLLQLRETLEHAALVVCYASSFSVDAATLDIPVINIDFEINKNEYATQSPTVFLGSEHYRLAVMTGGIQLAKSPEELRVSIERLVAQPAEKKEGRERLVTQQCKYTDGLSGKRVADALYNWL